VSGLAGRTLARVRTLEALLLLVLIGVAKRAVPMRFWSFLLGRPRAVPADWRGRAVERLGRTGPAGPAERVVVTAIRRAGRRLPWSPSCLAEAGAGQVMLRRRHRAGVVVIGLRPGAGAGAPAHAWLLGPSGPLLGAAASAGFTPVTVFQVESGVRAEDVPLQPAVSGGEGPARRSAGPS
jgi:hypothetical protein